VTPFVLDPISIPVPSCVFDACSTSSVFRIVSEQLRVPLWCGSGGDISLNSGLRHDDIESQQLRQLETSLPLPDDAWHLPPGVDKSHTALTNLLHQKWTSRSEDRKDRLRLLNCTNSKRCKAPPSVLSDRLIDAVSIPRKPLDQNGNDCIMSTPQQFFELRRSQQQRAEDLDDMIKKFVCCVPKAGVRRSATEHCRRGDASSSLDLMLLEPLEEYHRPFREAQARLSSFFPDKKLIQFDSGKLQTLAALLRELKKDGHRCLIFTQMSKMLDILEAFLNLNAHTYLRLDGSTGVERRQRLMDRFNNDTKMFCFILSTRSGGLGINLTGAGTFVVYVILLEWHSTGKWFHSHLMLSNFRYGYLLR
jgi:Helicase conserved C-terminal domain